jgi:hypothetical protein
VDDDVHVEIAHCIVSLRRWAASVLIRQEHVALVVEALERLSFHASVDWARVKEIISELEGGAAGE